MVLVRHACALALIALTGGIAAVDATTAATPPAWKNCAAVNARYPHGIGRANARDATSDEPVTTFKRSTKLYRLAMKYNRGLDRDHDGIACEKL